jgi:hypothetical protein
MGGKYYGDGCGDETWIEIAQGRVHCSLVLMVLNRRELVPEFNASLSVSKRGLMLSYSLRCSS